MVLFVCCALCTTLYAQDKPSNVIGSEKTLHVYLLIGQSNMAGRAPFAEKDSGVIERCYLLNNENAWEPAKNPLNRYSTIRKGIGMQKMNPGYSFSQTILEKNKGISIALVVNARGGTNIAQWKKGTQFYNEALMRTVEAQKTGTLKGILWHQGESDSRSPDTYLEVLKDLVLNLRKDLDVPNLPFVAGQIFYHPQKKPHTKQINKQIALLPDLVPFTGYVESTDLTTFDSTHFDTQGMRLLGQCYAEEMLKLQSKMKAEQITNADR